MYNNNGIAFVSVQRSLIKYLCLLPFRYRNCNTFFNINSSKRRVPESEKKIYISLHTYLYENISRKKNVFSNDGVSKSSCTSVQYVLVTIYDLYLLRFYDHFCSTPLPPRSSTFGSTTLFDEIITIFFVRYNFTSSRFTAVL